MDNLLFIEVRRYVMQDQSHTHNHYSFQQVTPHIQTNSRLREPQRDAAQALDAHFREQRSPALVQIPVGCGKSGLT